MGGFISSVDNRPMLRVTVQKIIQLSKIDATDDNLDVYVQLTYGKLAKMTEKGKKDNEPSLITKISNKMLNLPENENDINSINSNMSIIDENSNDTNEKNNDKNENGNDNKIENESNETNEATEKISYEIINNINDNNEHSRKNSMGRDSLSYGKPSTITQLSETKETDRQCLNFYQTFYFPVAALNARYSLEISVWDKEFGPQITDKYIGKAIIYYNNYENEYKFEPSWIKNEMEEPVYFLPNNWHQIKTFNIDIKDETGNFNNGTLQIELEFIQKLKRYSSDQSITMENKLIQENDDQTKLIKSNKINKKSKNNPRKSETIVHYPEAGCCQPTWY